MAMNKRSTLWVSFFGVVALSAALISCSGSTDGGPAGDETFNGDSFVGDGNTAGDMTLTVVDPEILVSDTTGFFVTVRDAQGGPVPGLEIACDTEQGLALVEPSTGFELTDSNGAISGKLGCVYPGSYQVGCRLPLGANQRRFQTVHCDGPVPVGFTGFPGAGGGSLGTDTGSGGNSIEGEILLSGVDILDLGSDSGGNSVDVVRGSCGVTDENGNGVTTDPCDKTVEPFFDTVVKLTVTNNTNETVFFNSFQYSINSADSSGDLNSTITSLSSSGSVAAGESADFKGLFLKTFSPGTDTCARIGIGDRKRFTGRSGAISASLGFKNVTFRLFGVTTQGQDVTLVGRTGISFGNFDNC